MDTPFSSNKIKYLLKRWKQDNYLNFAKLAGIWDRIKEVSLTSLNGNMITYVKFYIPIIQNPMVYKENQK